MQLRTQATLEIFHYSFADVCVGIVAARLSHRITSRHAALPSPDALLFARLVRLVCPRARLAFQKFSSLRVR